MRKVISLCLLFLLAACQSVQVSDSSHLADDEVVKVLEESGVKLTEAEAPRDNIFGSKLKGVNPRTYELSGKLLFIYEFVTSNDREEGTEEFEEKTATMNLVSYQQYVKRNILIFYVHELDINTETIPFEKEIQEALDTLIEG